MRGTTKRAKGGTSLRRVRQAALWGVCVLLPLAWGPSPVRAEVEPEGSSEEGIVARFGGVAASFRFFGDVGASYDGSAPTVGASKTNFLAGTFDFFCSQGRFPRFPPRCARLTRSSGP